MYETEKTLVINGNIGKVYAVAETYPMFVQFYKRKEIVFEDQERSVVRVSNSFYGIVLCWEGEGIKDRHKCINFTQTKGLLKGLKAQFIFEPVENNKTKVTIKAKLAFHFFFGRVLEKILGNLLIPNTVAKISLSLKNAVENANSPATLKGI